MLLALAAALDLSPAEFLSALEDGAAVDERAGSRRILDVVSGPVAWCDADDVIMPVARQLYEGNFSQMPVRESGRWTGLLTTEAIARWMAGRATRGLDVDERAPVREVIAYAEEADNLRIVGSDERAAEVANLFAERAAQGRPLAAVLVVEDEPGGDELLGIVTQYDWPSLGSDPGVATP